MGAAPFASAEEGRRRTLVRQGRRAVAAALLVGSVAACSSAEQELDPHAALPVVVQGPGQSAAPAPNAEAAQRALERAQAAWRAGDALTAVAVANQALRDGGATEAVESALRELRARARGAVVGEKVVRVEALPDRDVVADGEAVPVRIVFRNLSTGTLHVPRTDAGASDAVVVLSIVRRDYDVYGNRNAEELTLRAPLERDLEVPPGGTAEMEIVVGPHVARLRHQGLSVLDVGGTFRPVVVRVGETEFFDPLPIRPARVRVLMQGYEPLAEAPFESLVAAVGKRSPPHVLTAAELVAPADRARAAEFLRSAADRDPELAFVLRAAEARLLELSEPPASAALPGSGR